MKTVAVLRIGKNMSANRRRAMDAVRSVMQRAAASADPDRTPKRRTRSTCPNSRVYLTVANPQTSTVQCRATRDKSDHAHAVFETTGRTGEVLLVPAARVDSGTRPRRYPDNQLTSRGVAFDSSFDELSQRELRLSDMGLTQKQRTVAESKYDAATHAARYGGIRSVIDRNHAHEVESIASTARYYLRSGQITQLQHDAMVSGR